MTTEANTVLNEEQTAEIETAQVKRRESLAFHQSEYPGLPTPDYIAQIDALCQTVKALRGQIDLLQSQITRLAGLAELRSEVIAAKAAHVDQLQSRLSEVEREGEAAYQHGYDDGCRATRATVGLGRLK